MNLPDSDIAGALTTWPSSRPGTAPRTLRLSGLNHSGARELALPTVAAYWATKPSSTASSRQVQGIVRSEALIVAVLGWALAAPIGWAIGKVLVLVVADLINFGSVPFY